MLPSLKTSQLLNSSDRQNSSQSDRATVTPSLPILWLDSIDGCDRHANDFQLLTFNDEAIPGGYHVIALNSERDIRRSLRKLQAVKADIRGIYPGELVAFSTAIDILVKGVYPEAWLAATKQNPLTPEEALNIASDILEDTTIRRTQKNIELEELRGRCGVSSFDWNRFIQNLEQEIHTAVDEKTTDRKRLELQAIAQEKDPYKFTDRLIEFCRRTGWSRTDALQQIRLSKLGVRTPKAKRFKGKDFLAKETEALSWVFPGQIPARGITVLGGVAGSGKSTLAYDAAVSFLLHEEFLGEKPVKTGKVLIVSSDELPCFIQDKLIDRGMPLDNEDWEILTDWDVSQWDTLEEAIEEIKPAFVLIDSFSSIHRDPNFDENSTQAKATIYDLEALSNSYGFGCILIHHLSKGKDNKGVAKLRGSSAIAAACSVVALLEANPDGSRMLSFPKIRGAQTSSMRIALNPQSGRYEVILGGDSASTKTLARQILDFLSKEPSERFTPEEIFHALGLTNKDSGHQALRRCFQRGQVVKRPNRTGRGSVYGIAANELTVTPVVQEPLSTQQDSLSPLVEKVSVQIAETVEVQATEVADTLTDTLTDSVQNPTPVTEAQPLNAKKLAQTVGQIEGILWNGDFTPTAKKQKLSDLRRKQGQSVYEAAIARLSSDDRQQLEQLRASTKRRR
jgi:KaiC/GvpD/RAD55 family RecA-like ATPase